MKRFFTVALFFTVFLFGNTVRVALSANMSYAIDELIKAYKESNPNVDIEFNIGSSGKLTAQITKKAPYDIFLSANMLYPQKLYKEGFTITKPKVYAKGMISLVSVRGIDLSKGIDILKSSSIKKIAIANPKTAPYGKATFEAIQNKNLLPLIKDKLVYGESVAQTVLYTLKVADVGIVATSVLYNPKIKRYKRVTHKIVNRNLYTPIKQGIVLLSYAKNNPEARNLYRFFLSKKAQDILSKYGYQKP